MLHDVAGLLRHALHHSQKQSSLSHVHQVDPTKVWTSMLIQPMCFVEPDRMGIKVAYQSVLQSRLLICVRCVHVCFHPSTIAGTPTLQAPEACISHSFLMSALQGCHARRACLFDTNVERAAAQLSANIRMHLRTWRLPLQNPFEMDKLKARASHVFAITSNARLDLHQPSNHVVALCRAIV